MSDPVPRPAPWPSMRGNPRNTGVSAARGVRYEPPAAGAAPPPGPRRWRTGNAVFSTPVIDGDETVYAGSADGAFYAWDPLGELLRWRFQTGEAIDCAACIDPADGTLYVPSCDGSLYALDAAGGRPRWRLDLLRERRRFTPSTIYWWEGNVALGPGGLLYAGNDDFHFYAIGRDGVVRWAFPTGLHIWTAPAFGDDGAVYFVSFDLHAYALDAATGALRWRTDVGNFVASSPAIAPDGTIVFGTFDGSLLALDPARGAIVRRHDAGGGPIYATPAIAPDGTVYLGAADGAFRAISLRERRTLWSFYTGDPIRSSAALGPDPEGRAPYLVYAAGGNGSIYAFDPDGRRRWSFEAAGAGADFPNVNASIAVGARGIATASASGDLLYVPFEAARAGGDGFSREPGDGFPRDGAAFYFLSPGGTPETRPLGPAAGGDARPAGGVQTIGLRALLRRGGETVPARFAAGSLAVETDPPVPLRVLALPGAAEVAVLPLEPLPAGRPVRLTARARLEPAGGGGPGEPIEGRAVLERRPPPREPAPRELLERPFRISHMSVHAPSIVPSFDQIGIASLRIDVRAVHAAESGRLIFWGLMKFGATETGEAVGVPVARHLVYAFAGDLREGHLILEAERCRFELTAAPVPLDRLRLAGGLDDALAPALGSSLSAELAWPGAAALLRPAGGLRAAGRRLARALAYVRTWFPPGAPLAGRLLDVARAAGRALPLARRLLSGELHRPWGLLDAEGRFAGAGTFRASPLPPAALDPRGATLRRLAHDPGGRRIVAEIAPGPDPRPTAVAGIVLVDLDRARPVALDYDAALSCARDARGNPVRAALELPASLDLRGRRIAAIALLDLAVLGELVVPSGLAQGGSAA